MKFVVDSRSLIDSVLSVSKALPVRTSMPALEGVYMKADSLGLHIMCSDLMMQKECVLSANIQEEGECLVKGKLFAEMIRKLPEESAFVSLNGSTLTIRCGKTVNHLQVMEYEEYPVMKFDGTKVENIVLDKEACRQLITRTAFCVGLDESRPMLAGVYMEAKDKEVSMVATDSFQFAKNVLHVEKALTEKNCIIPGRTILETARMTEESGSEAITLTFSRTHMQIDLGTTVMVARLLDGNYIDYNRLIPKECKTRALVDKESFVDSVERAQLVAREGNNSVKLSFNDGSLFVRAESAVGKVEDEIPAQIMGSGIDIAFNPKYVLNVLKNVSAEKVYVEMNSPINPCVIRPQSDEDSLFLIVPMRVL